MEVDSAILEATKTTFLDIQNTINDVLDLDAPVWKAAEALIGIDLKQRRAGMDRLVEMGSIQNTPLIAYLAATRIVEADVPLRSRIVAALADAIRPDKGERIRSEEVSQLISTYLNQMRTREIYSLLQLAAVIPSSKEDIITLLSFAPRAGKHLGDILLERKMPLEIRMKAVEFIGRIGYCEALPMVERLMARLEPRINGQKGLPQLAGELKDEIDLAPFVQNTLGILRAP